VDELAAVGGLVSAVAALGALVFAYLTVRQARQARAEEKAALRLQSLQRVSEIVGELGDAMLRGLDRSYIPLNVLGPINQRRLAAALAAVPDELPACDSLTKPEPDELKTQWRYMEVKQQSRRLWTR
jgi:hypothetical protein